MWRATDLLKQGPQASCGVLLLELDAPGRGGLLERLRRSARRARLRHHDEAGPHAQRRLRQDSFPVHGATTGVAREAGDAEGSADPARTRAEAARKRDQSPTRPD